jgi:PD-(D/E)XK nuclease superfamily
MPLPVVTTSSRSAFRRCPQKWVWRFEDGLSPKGEMADALWFGIGIHEALANWYQKGRRRGVHPATTFTNWCSDEMREIRAAREEWEDQAKYENAMDLGIAMLEGYIDKYGKDPSWSVIATEQPFKIKVTWHGKPIALFMSTWDGVYRDMNDGRLYLMEHKTAGQISLAYLELDDQAGSYWAVASEWLRAKGILGPGDEIAGIMYNFLRKTPGDDRPQNEGGAYLNKDGSVSKKQPPPAFVRHLVERTSGEQKVQLERLAREVAVMNAVRDGTIPVTKNTTKDCTFCEFFAACTLHEHGSTRAFDEYVRHSFTRTNPFDRYLKSASG